MDNLERKNNIKKGRNFSNRGKSNFSSRKNRDSLNQNKTPLDENKVAFYDDNVTLYGDKVTLYEDSSVGNSLDTGNNIDNTLQAESTSIQVENIVNKEANLEETTLDVEGEQVDNSNKYSEEELEESTNMKLQQSRIAMKQDSIEEDKIFLADQFTHPYFDEDPDIGLPREEYNESPTLMRGCVDTPQSYKTISKQELFSCEKLHVTNWMENVKPPSAQGYFDYVEVRFKNSHKDFYKIPEGLEICEGDLVAVESSSGHDIGIVSLAGELCRIQMRKKKGFNIDNVKKLYRRAKATDIEKWLDVIKKEDSTLFTTRTLALDENLDMKINDVEYQGDGTKAIFYYTASDRVDFRHLIRALADAFHIKIEMKQIGVRQEAARLGGIGTCGRELCCSTWLGNFTSVGTSVAKVQQLFPNPQKLAGQCGKLKCCLNYEYDVYQDAMKDFPPLGVDLETSNGRGCYRKTDVLKKIIWYSYKDSSDMIPISAWNVKKILSMNRSGRMPKDLESFKEEIPQKEE